MPKEKKLNIRGQTTRHAPLGQVIQEDANRGKYAKTRVRPNGPKREDDVGDEEDFLDEKISSKIFAMSKEQQLEVEAEEQQESKRRKNLIMKDDSDDENIDEESVIIDEGDDDLVEHDAGYVSINKNAVGLTEEEEAIVAAMMGDNKEERRTLADIILEKINEKQMMENGDEEEEGEQYDELPPKVVEVYTDIGKILSRYTSGKLPKAFKVLPSLSNWEEVLYLTRPDLWTPQAMFSATRLFASNLNPKMAQRFYNLVLLDSVRADIMHNHKLNYHYFMALKKAVYKPAAFFKGILLPLCKENCTLREAAIIASVLQRVTVPREHSAVAIHKLAQMDYSGAASIFLKTLLNKKYSLPAPVIGTMVKHFASFIDDTRTLPVLWHQCLLVFVQRYKNEVKDEARNLLRQVMKQHFHPKITPEIRRELFGIQAFREERLAMETMET